VKSSEVVFEQSVYARITLMKDSLRCAFVFLLVAVMSGAVIPAGAQTSEVPGTAWELGGVSRLKVKKFGKFAQLTFGRIDFRRNGRFLLDMKNFFTLSGTYDCRGRRCLLTPEPDSLEKALLSLLEGSLFEAALRGIEPRKAKFKIKIRNKKGTDVAKVRFKIVFNARLALAVENPEDPEAEVIEPFRMKYRYKGFSPSE